MVNLNWEQLRAVNVDEIGEEEAGQIYQQLIDVDVADENDIQKLKLLFRVTQAVMQAKSVQAEIALDELEQLAEKSGVSKNEQQLQDKIDQLNRQIKKLKAQVGNVTKVNNEDETENLKLQIERMRADLQEKDRHLSHEKRENERWATRTEELDRERKDLSHEISHLKDEIEDYRRQLDVQNDSSYQKSSKDQEYSIKVREKNRQINKLLEDIESAELQNAQFQRQVAELRDKLQESTEQMDKTTADYIQLKNAVKQSEGLVENLRQENQTIKLQINDLAVQNQTRIAADDEIIAAVNHRVEEWKAVLSGKEALIIRLQNEVKQLQESLAVSGSISNKMSINILSKVVEERDKQITVLKQELERATHEFEESASFIEKLKVDKSSGNANEWQLKQIESLQTRLSQAEARESEIKQKCDEAESHAQVKDKELTEALAKMKQYEMGEYGLRDAVQEIKNYKLQLHLRDQQIEELNTIVNHTELALGELKEENEELYERLGIDRKVLEYSEIQTRIAEKRQREKALNKVLQAEIDTLEEERLLLKQEIRKLAQIVGHRASQYGLTAEDAAALQNFAEKLSNKNVASVDIDREATQTKLVLSEFTQQVKQLQYDLVEARKKLFHVPLNSLEQPKSMNFQIASDDEEVFQLLKAFRSHCGEAGIKSPVVMLKKLLLSFDSVDGGDERDLTVHLQSEVECLIREKEKLESDLVAAQKDNENVQQDLILMKTKADELEFRCKDKMADPFDESDALAKVNSFIAYYLKQLQNSAASGRESSLSLSDSEVKNLEEKFNAEISQLKNVNDILNAAREENDLKGEEYEKLLNVMSNSDDRIKKEIAEMNRKLIVATVNENKLARKCSFLLEQEVQSRKQSIQLQNEILAMQGAVLHRVNYLEQFKDIAVFKIASLYKALENSVSTSELDTVKRQYNELMGKYQQLLQQDRDLILNIKNRQIIETDAHYFQRQNDFLQRELQATLEKLHRLESATHLLTEGSVTEMGLLPAKKVALLEIKELNERQRADHAIYIQDEQRQTISKLESRNEELEKKFGLLTKLNFEQQQTERELRLELEECVSKQEYERVCDRLEYLSAQEILLKKEITQMKEIVEVAENQVSAVEILHAAKVKEVKSLEQHLLDVQSENDDKTLIGKLYRQLVTCQVSEASTQLKLEKCRQQLQKIEALSLRLEQRCDEKDQVLYHFRNESRLKINRLKRTIQELRQFQGTVQQEDFLVGMIEIQSDKLKVQKELDEACSLHHIAEVKMIELEEKNKCLDELISTIKEGRETQKVLEWHNKIMELRLLEMKKSHQIERLSHDLDYKQQLIKKQEETIASLERKIVHAETVNNEQQLAWEARELELEKMVTRLEDQKLAPLSKVDVAFSPIPDATLPLAEQLNQALHTIKSNSIIFMKNAQQHKDLKKEAEFMKKRIQELEITIGAQEKVIGELRLELSANHTETTTTTEPRLITYEENFAESGPALQVAQAVVESLKARLLQKEETISNYQILLRKAREDLEDMAQNNQKEIEAVQAKIHVQTKNAVMLFQHEVQQSLTRAQASSQISEQITKMNELQEIAIQQDTAISILTEKLKASSKEIQQWQLKVEATAKELLQDKETMQEEYETLVQKFQREGDVYKGESLRKENELENVKKELEKQLELNKKAPSTLMKNVIEKMKQQLHIKEKQIQALSNALAELKNDMKSMIEDNILTRTTAAIDQVDIQALISRQTAILQEKLNAVIVENEHLRKGLRKDDIRKKELLKIKEELDKQTSISSDLLKEKQHLEQVIQDLESKIKRISRTEERDVLEVSLLQSKIKNLEEKLAKQHPAEKPYDAVKEKVHSSPKTLALETWEEAKKYQQLVTKLKSKLNEKEMENAALEKSVTTLKNIITRIEKEKIAFEKKMKTVAPKENPQPENNSAAFHHLYKRNCVLQDELTTLKRQLFVEKDLVIEEMKKKNEFLGDKIDELNQKLHSSTLSPKKVSVTLTEELRKLREKEENLQKDILRLSQENLELQFEVQKTKADLPLYVDQVKQLERCIEMMRSEKIVEQHEVSDSPRRTRVGINGKNVLELEKTIGALKKLIEKLQTESEQLKRRLHDGNKNNQLLEEENKSLKEQLLSAIHGAPQLQDSHEKQSTKILAHNERLLHDLQKEVKANETLRVQLYECKSENEKLQKSCSDLQKTVDNLESQHPNLTHLGGQRWKAEAISRLYEEKLKTTANELHKQSQMAGRLKTLLSEAILIEDEYLKIAGKPRKKMNENCLTIRNRFQQLLTEVHQQ